MPITSKKMIRLLKKNGFTVISQNGSHVKMRNEKTGRQTIIPYHSGTLKTGLQLAILKQSGLYPDNY